MGQVGGKGEGTSNGTVGGTGGRDRWEGLVKGQWEGQVGGTGGRD